MAKKTKMPPCGARRVHAERHDSAPVTAAAGHHRRDDPQRVGGGERDRALGDERRAEQPGRLAVLPLGLAEQLRAYGGRQSHRQRRDHPGRHHRGHDLQRGAGCVDGDRGQPAMAKAYAALLTGPPRSKHIIRPRMTPSTMRGAAGQAVQPVRQARRDRGDRLAEHQEHQAADDQRREQRDDHDRHEAAAPGGHRHPADPQRGEAGEQTADEAADEAGADVTATQPAAKPGAMPGRSAIANAMYPARAGTRKPNASDADLKSTRSEVGRPGRRRAGPTSELFEDDVLAVRRRSRSRRAGSRARSADRPRRRTGSCS